MASQDSLYERPGCYPCNQDGFEQVTANFICQDCAGPERHMCSVCQARHDRERSTSQHRVIALEEYLRDRTKYILAKNGCCKKHPEKTYELICEPCKEFLCSKCLGDPEEICPKSCTGAVKHVPVALEYGADELKENLQEAEGKSDAICTKASLLMVEVGDMKKNAAVLLSDTVSSIEEEGRHLRTKVDEKTHLLRTEAEERMNKQIQELTDIETRLQMFLEDKANDKTMAKDALACPVPLEVHRTVPELISRLEESPVVSLPDALRIQLVTAGVQELDALLDSISLTFSTSSVASGCASAPQSTEPASPPPSRPMEPASPPPSGPIEPASPPPFSPIEPASPLHSQLTEPIYSIPVTHTMVPLLPSSVKTMDCAAIPSVHHLAIDAAADGLWVRDGAGRRRRMGKQVDCNYMGVCMSEDGRHCYCTRTKLEGVGNIEKYRVKDDGALELEREREVDGGGWLSGISMCSASDLLAVVNTERTRITLHSCDDLRLVRVIQNAVNENEKLFPWPVYIAWATNGASVYVSDRGSVSLPRSVTCLCLSEPPRVVWKRILTHYPCNVSYIRGLVYVTGDSDSQVTVLSADDGKVREIIPCPGVARGVWEDSTGGVVITSYCK